MILEGLRAYRTLFYRQEKSFQDHCDNRGRMKHTRRQGTKPELGELYFLLLFALDGGREVCRLGVAKAEVRVGAAVLELEPGGWGGRCRSGRHRAAGAGRGGRGRGGRGAVAGRGGRGAVAGRGGWGRGAGRGG
jgi:hypothetical protein